MIKVVIHYHQHYKVKQCKSECPDRFIYTDVLVEGHANDGTNNAIKCCAGITAVLYGFIRLVSGIYDSIKIDNGFFHYVYGGTDNRVQWDTMYAMNCVTSQLYEIYRCYPQFFSQFDFIEDKGEN